MYFFPTPYPDELFYSIIARYHYLSGNVKNIHTVLDLFGTRNAVSTIEFPSRLEELNNSLPKSIQIDISNIIQKNTLLDFYCAFKSNEVREDIIKAMYENGGKGIHVKLGLVSGGTLFHKYLRYCPSCIKEDTDSFGGPYWHREHQIAGVYLCTKHACLTLNSDVLRNQTNRQQWFTLSTNIAKDSGELNEYTMGIIDNFKTYSSYAYYLLKNPQSRNLEWIKKRYRIILFEKGYARLNNYVKINKLTKDIINYFPAEYLRLMNCNDNFNWVINLLTGNKNPDTVKHLVFLQFLEVHPSEFFDSKYDDLGSIDIKEYFQSIWDNRLTELIKIGKSQREIFQIMKTSRITVIKRLNELGIEVQWAYNGGTRYKKKYTETDEFQAKKVEMRNSWIKWHEENPKLGSHSIRRDHDFVYAWLHKYDNDWVKKSYRVSNKSNTTRVNWTERDYMLLEEVNEVIQSIILEGSNRVTLGRVAAVLNIKGWIYKKSQHIPLTMEYINSHLESVEEFHKRKLNTALNQQMLDSSLLSYNKVFEKAKINYRYKERYRRFTEEKINEILK